VWLPRVDKGTAGHPYEQAYIFKNVLIEMFDIVLGRDDSEKESLGQEGLVFLGRLYVNMGNTTSLSNNVYLDVAKSHVILVCGKRGSGKSYTLSVIAEEIANLPAEVKQNMAVVIFDTMGIFWSMKYPNERQRDLLARWKLKPSGLNVKVFTPIGKFQEYKDKGIDTDYGFSIQPSELSAGDWCGLFQVKLVDDIGVLIERVVSNLHGNYEIDDILKMVEKDKKSDRLIKDAVFNRFDSVKNWGLFSSEGNKFRDVVQEGRVSILDISCYTEWDVKCLVVGLVCKKLLQERMDFRKKEELKMIESGVHYFSEDEKSMPLVWMMIDEGHEFLPRKGKTLASDALIQILREGRQPGISLILATQQPGEIHQDVMTQADIVISHRVTAKPDIEALNAIMHTYLTSDILSHLNQLPGHKGSAIVLDDNSERIYSFRTRPKLSWHSGESPSSVKKKKIFSLD